MSFGLQLHDGGGTLDLDISDRLTRLYGTYYVNVPSGVGSVDVSAGGIDPTNFFATGGGVNMNYGYFTFYPGTYMNFARTFQVLIFRY